MKLITINSNKSTTIGGVESLMRFLYELGIEYEIFELYCKVGSKEVYQENINATYMDYSVNSKFGLLSKVALKINQIKTVRHINAQDNDVIITFHPNDLLYMPFSVLRKSEIIVVQTNRFDIYFKPFSKIIVSLLNRFIDHITVYTEKDKSTLSKMYPGLEKKAKVIPRGCRLACAESTRSFSKKLVTVARIDEEQKNFSSMLDVLSTLPDGYSLDIYGGGTPQEVSELKSRISKVPNAYFKGEVADDLSQILQQYSVFLMTSRYEGFGQTLIEARSQGLPIVVFDNFDALSFIVENGINGFSIANNNREEFAQKIIDLCSDESLYKNMSGNALIKAKETDVQLVKKLWKEIL